MPPVNDDFADAIVLTGTSGSEPIDTEDGTRETGDPMPWSRPCTVWFKFVAPSDGLLDLEVRATDPDYTYSVDIATWIGTTLGGLTMRNSFDLPGFWADDTLVTLCPTKLDAGQTCYVELADNGDLTAGLRDLNWRFIEPPAWGEMEPATGTGSLVTAMNSFGGAAFPTSADANGGIWDAPDDWKDSTGHASVGSDHLRLEMDDGATQFQWLSLVYADADSADAEDPDFEGVTWSGPVEWQMGFQVENFHWDDRPYGVARWNAGGGQRLGIDLSSQNGGTAAKGYVHMIPYLSGPSETIPIEQDWLIKVKFVYVPTGGLEGDEEWQFSMSLDGGTTWRLLSYTSDWGPRALTAEFNINGANVDSDDSGWVWKFDGWGAPVSVPGGYFRKIEWGDGFTVTDEGRGVIRVDIGQPDVFTLLLCAANYDVGTDDYGIWALDPTALTYASLQVPVDGTRQWRYAWWNTARTRIYAVRDEPYPIRALAFSMNPDGSGLTEIGTLPDMQTIQYNPWLGSPAKFVGRDALGLQVLNEDGSTSTIFTNADHAPSPYEVNSAIWSIDGTKLAVKLTEDISSYARVYVFDPVTEAMTLLVDEASPSAFSHIPRWNPLDNGQMCFTSLPAGSEISIDLINEDGTDQETIYTVPPSDFEICNYYPVWSPDGTKIAFYTYGDGYPEIFLNVIDTDGNLLERSPNLIATSFRVDERRIAWSPDSDAVALALTLAPGVDIWPLPFTTATTSSEDGVNDVEFISWGETPTNEDW